MGLLWAVDWLENRPCDLWQGKVVLEQDVQQNTWSETRIELRTHSRYRICRWSMFFTITYQARSVHSWSTVC